MKTRKPQFEIASKPEATTSALFRNAAVVALLSNLSVIENRITTPDEIKLYQLKLFDALLEKDKLLDIIGEHQDEVDTLVKQNSELSTIILQKNTEILNLLLTINNLKNNINNLNLEKTSYINKINELQKTINVKPVLRTLPGSVRYSMSNSGYSSW